MRSHTGRPQTLVEQQEHLGPELEPESGPGRCQDFEEGGPDKSPEGFLQVVLNVPDNTTLRVDDQSVAVDGEEASPTSAAEATLG